MARYSFGMQIRRLTCISALALLSGCVTHSEAPRPSDLSDRIAEFRRCEAISPPVDAEWLDTGQESILRFVLMMPRNLLTEAPNEAIDEPSWSTVPSALESHLRIRQNAKEDMPSGVNQILIYRYKNHWDEVQSSTVVTEQSNGLWNVDRLQQHTAIFPSDAFVREKRVLSSADSRRLESLIADDCLFAHPTNSHWSIIDTSDDETFTMEFRGVAGAQVIAGSEIGFGRVGLIIHLID